MSDAGRIFGTVFIVVGVLVAAYCVFGLKINTVIIDEPHPLRFVFAGFSILSGTFFGLVLLSLATIIENQESQKYMNAQQKSTSA
ncbi:hypothetical protein FZC76_18100 [Sutcliffiella horikoshii]|uniref:Uncharacterized protein n=1 Tax=Sutcliffiella horikoshii TaxID=79883 RepID=A0A5D4SM27_9BACI|nr:hypothetical protein [Sutcliffiella horikoshii]TYS64475.1 hypothetical protein FZC76_18100 [Sutcliffiella horikoshii]